MNEAAEKFGQRMRRREDASLLTGKGVYLAGLVKPGTAAMRVIRSPVAHARVKGIESGGIETHPDCIGFITAADLPSSLGALPALDLLAASAAVHHCVLARNTVRYVGEPVAVVIATDEYIAEDLTERVRVDYEALPVILDVAAGTSAEATRLYPEHGSNIVHETLQHVGNPEQAFAVAAIVIEETFAFRRVMGSPMETRGAMATLEPDSGRYVLHSSTQIPQVLRSELARITGIELEQLRVVSPRIGGGFGCKEAVYAEEVLVLLALQKFGRPVYWIEDRAESFSATVHGREETIRVRAALETDGTVTAIEAECLADIGAAYSLFTNTPSAAVATLRGPYRIPHFKSRARSVVTNKTPLNVYRGAGYPQATLAMERMMDLAATRLRLDRAEIRRRNLLAPDAFPVDRGVSYPGCGRMIYDSGNFPALLDSTLDAIGYSNLPARRAAMQCAQPGVSLGLGLSFVVEMTSGGGTEPARLKLLESGNLQLMSGITAIGQGSETTMAQILSDHLGCPSDMIVVSAGDTDESPNAPGTFASRGATMGGNAACRAGDALVREARLLAAQLTGAALDGVRWQQGALVVDGRSQPMTLQMLAAEACAHGIDPLARLDVTARFDDTGIGYASACHAATVAVDRDTGIIRVLEYAVTHDCGRIANPLLVDGQIMGGVLQGLGGCLFEALEYSDTGLPLSKTYMDYVLPTAATAPRFILRHIETPSPLNPLGMKGAGEAGCSGAAGAIANAIADALGPQVRLPGGSGPFTPALIRELLQNHPTEDSHRC